ncbi:hypothetical protein MUP00_10735 [Candidatus Bathyarchaeota archaeon]|jgi:archaellum component FlaF (FlaF/FlaG flagellin family)|nr:hypothetical protein [Candidatus Bathyarchaeota archaeon]
MSVLTSKGILFGIVAAIIIGSTVGFGLAYATFQSPINDLQTSNTQLKTTLTDLQQSYVSASLKDDKLSNSVSHNIKGTVINFGTATASNIIITVKWYNLGASFHQEIITIPSLEGRAMKDISFSYIFGGSADDFQYTITWS